MASREDEPTWRERPWDPRKLAGLQEQRLLEQEERQERLEEATAALPDLLLVRALAPAQRLVILALYWGEIPVTELARIIGKKPGTVRQLETLAVDAMRRQLDGAATADAPTESKPRT